MIGGWKETRVCRSDNFSFNFAVASFPWRSNNENTREINSDVQYIPVSCFLPFTYPHMSQCLEYELRGVYRTQMRIFVKIFGFVIIASWVSCRHQLCQTHGYFCERANLNVLWAFKGISWLRVLPYHVVMFLVSFYFLRFLLLYPKIRMVWWWYDMLGMW